MEQKAAKFHSLRIAQEVFGEKKGEIGDVETGDKANHHDKRTCHQPQRKNYEYSKEPA